MKVQFVPALRVFRFFLHHHKDDFDMQIDLFNIWFVIGCCTLPYFVLVTALLTP
jgi:hypothetical protein